ncbi:MAG TPA: hypothetical protein VHL53_03270 [Acidimicrobiia bacterium]|nr:hypothetical protein [Acidimicrobiia bacterium]
MPTLEDTVDFKVITLNDLIDADVRTGVPVAADDKYKRWAFLATGVAVMLAIGLVVALVTGGDDGGSGGTKVSRTVAEPPDTTPLDFSLGSTVGTGIEPGAGVTVINAEGQAVGGGTVLKITQSKAPIGKGVVNSASVAVRNADLAAVNAALAKGKVRLQPGLPQTTTSTAAPTAPVPIEPAPATTPTS